MRALSRLWPELSAEEEARFEAERGAQNLERLTWGLGIVLCVHLFTGVLFTVTEPALGDGPVVLRWRSLIVAAHAAWAVVGVAGLALGLWTRRTGAAWGRAVLPPVLAMAYLAFGAAVASVDQLVTSAITPFVAACLALALLLRLSPLLALVEVAAATALFLVGLRHFQADPAVRLTNTSNSVTMALLGALLAASFSVFHRRDFAQRRTILRQNAELEAAFARSRELAARAEAASHAKSTFLATMSHEIRTPLNGVLGLAELLATSPLGPEQLAQVRTIGEAGRSLLAVINDVLDFSKIEAGQLRLEEAPFDARQLLLAVRELFAAQAEAKGLELTARWPDSAPRWFLGDEGRLRQVLSNLVGNAVKFTARGSVRLEGTAAAGLPLCQLELRVVDTGIGLTPEQLPRLFQPFSQADASTTRRFGGTGLGLAISKRLVEAMGGTVGGEGAPGRGSTFWIHLALPAAEHLEAGAPAPLPTAHRFRGRVLVAEDNPINMLVARQMLGRLGLEVLEATDGQAALGLLGREPVDLVFTDLHMPALDGYQLARALREGGLKAPIVAVTANVMPEDLARCREAGMDDSLSKPISLADLERVLRRWLPGGELSAVRLARRA